MKILVVLMSLVVSPVFAAEQKIAVFEIQKVVAAVEDGKKASQEMETAFEQRKKSIDAQKTAMKKLIDEYKKQELVLKQSELNEKRKEIETKQLELQEAGMKAEMELREKEGALRDKITEKITSVIEKLGKSKQYTVIIEKEASGAIFVKPEIDITSQVIAEYNKAYHSK